MRAPLAVALLLVGIAATQPTTAIAREDLGENVEASLVNAQLQHELRAEITRPGVTGGGDTVFVGFRPGNVSSVNYWGLGTGNPNPYSSNVADYGYWGWDNDAVHDNIAEVHGDSLFGWWPVRVLMNGTGGQNRTDENRPWWAVDIGNTANYVINQGTALKRTFGVVGVWHPDAGSGAGGGVTWAPLGGLQSMWAGLRRHNDASHLDPITGNAFNADLLSHVIQGGSTSGGPVGSDALFPGYGNQWDQMAYRDIDVTGASTINVKFKFRSNMSTGRGTASNTRTGWFDKDPLAVTFNQSGNGNALGNFISSSFAANPPIDSFMVYVGAPVVDSLGSVPVSGGDWFLASDGVVRRVYDTQRRWFSEVLRANESGRHREIFTTYGNRSAQTVEITGISLASTGAGAIARLVFRSKTNRGFADEDGFVSGWNGGGAGGAVFDDVEIALDAGAYSNIGDFEDADDVDNDPDTNALDAWKTTGKPPSFYHHVHNMNTLQYDDLCGEVDDTGRTCNLRGNVISMGDHDNGEAAGGLTDGTVDREMWDGMISPTINLRNGGGTNAMGIDAESATATEDIYIAHDIYTGIFDAFTTGNLWRYGFSDYPAKQVDGQPIWSGWRLPAALFFNPDPQCFQVQLGGFGFGLIRWDPAQSESPDYPDSLRIMLHKRQECYRFGITTGCSPTDGAYWDNVSLALVDGTLVPISVNIWDWINDTFTVNGMERDANPLGSAEFDTTTALVKIGLNIAQNTNNTDRYAIPGDTTAVVAGGAEVQLDLVFRISPGPGNYRSLGVRSSGLRAVPTSSTGIDYTSPGTNFWANYLADGGPAGGSGNQHAANNVLGTNGGRDWSELAWNSARCDSAEQNFWRIAARGIGGPVDGAFASMYSEADGKFSTLGIAKNRCWLINAGAGVTSANIACGNPSVVTDGWPTANGYADEDGGGPLTLGQTYEYTKILPDGQFTPGTHVQYFFRREDLDAGPGSVSLAPDTNLVFPQPSEGSTDGHRWQQFSVLPDRWKKGAYGGLGEACMLFVDNNDRRGNERVWVSIADSLCSTQASKRGAHNGWSAARSADLNDPAGFVYNLNAQPGTTWDMYGVKASESLTAKTHGIGVDFSNHSPQGLINGQWSFCGPSIDMLEAFYSVILLLSGDLNSGVLGPFPSNGADDHTMLEQFLAGGQFNESNHRGLWAMGDGFVESEFGLPLLDDYFEVWLRHPSYFLESDVDEDCIDLVTQTPITTNGDIHGLRNSCLFTHDVLEPLVGSVPSTHYAPAGSGVPPLVSGVFHDIDEVNGEYWQALVDGFDIENLRTRFCETTFGRQMYFYNALVNIFGKICAIVGSPFCTTDVPNNPSGTDFVNFMNLRNNPLVTGRATVDFGLARKDRVTVSVYDVSGRLVRELADREFTPGNYSLTWDGVDNDGHQVPRGVYFTQVRYRNTGFTSARKVTVLK